MLFTDGECPLCGTYQLHLNESDLLECPNCNLVCSAADPLAATVLPFVGRGRFRLEDCEVHQFTGALVTKALGATVLPDYTQAFQTADDLRIYRTSLTQEATASLSDPMSLAKSFLGALRDSLLSCDGSRLVKAWPIKPKRTRLYAESTIPEVAKALRLTHLQEKFTVDHALVRLSINEHEVPQIYIESENDYRAATHEIRKLCSLNSPVRVLITATDKGFPPDPSGGAYAKLREWQALIRSHHQENSQFNGVVVIVIGQLVSDKLSFRACAFHSNGDLSIPMWLLLERNAG